MKKIAADLIATEMFRLLKKASEEDDANVNVKVDDGAKVNKAEDSADDYADDEDESDDEDSAEDNLESYLMNSVDDESDDEGPSYIDNEIDSMSDMASDMENELMRDGGSHDMMNNMMNGEDGLVAKSSDMRLMHGLGRIEASLRNKGEGFAADLVRATASSIKQDIVKEAAQRNYVVKNLVKMASDLERKGDRNAAVMVRSTIMKINR